MSKHRIECFCSFGSTTERWTTQFSGMPARPTKVRVSGLSRRRTYILSIKRRFWVLEKRDWRPREKRIQIYIVTGTVYISTNSVRSENPTEHVLTPSGRYNVDGQGAVWACAFGTCHPLLKVRWRTSGPPTSCIGTTVRTNVSLQLKECFLFKGGIDYLGHIIKPCKLGIPTKATEGSGNWNTLQTIPTLSWFLFSATYLDGSYLVSLS